MGLASVSSPCPPVLLPSLLPKELNQQGPLAPATLLAFFATVSPSDSLSPSTHFPVLPVIGPLFSGHFLPGRGGSRPSARSDRPVLPSPRARRLGLRGA